MPTIIKAAEQNPKLFRRLDSISVSDHFAEARLVVEKSRDQARHLLRAAQSDAVRIREETSKEGYESGFRRGYDSGKRAGQEEALAEGRARFESDQTQTLATLRAVIDDYETRKRDLFIAARQDVVRFAARVA